jgi:hypothetical protein
MTRQRTARTLAVLFTLAASLSACTPASKPGPGPIVFEVPHDPRVDIAPVPGQPNIYHWGGSDFVGKEDFLKGVHVQMKVAIAEASIVPHGQPAPSAGRLRLVTPVRPLPDLPPVRNRSGLSEAQDALREAEWAEDDARITLLQVAGLFTAVMPESGGAAPPLPADGNDFVLWLERGVWRLRYRHGDPRVLMDTPDLKAWLASVKDAAAMARRQGGEPGLQLTSASLKDGQLWFSFHGQAYSSLAELRPAMTAEFAREAHEVVPLTDRLGGTLKLIFPLTGPGIHLPHLGFEIGQLIERC